MTKPIISPLVATALASGLAVALLVGCEPRVASPKNPTVQVPASVAMQEAESMAKAKESEATSALRRFKVNSQKLESQYEISLADLQADLDEYVEKVQSEAVSLRATTEAAVKAAEARQSAWLGGVSTVAEIAQGTGIPGVAAIGGLLAGAVGLFSANSNKKKAEETSRVASRIIDAMDVLKLKSPEVAAAFKTHSKDLAEWIGPEGTALVNRVQHS